MKILAIGDLHGIKPKIHLKEFDCIIQVGDVCDDSKLIPYIKKWFVALKKDRENTPSLDKFILKNIGKERYFKLEKDSLKIGRSVLEYLNSLEKPVFIVPGNWDQSYGKSKVKDIDKDDYSYMKSFYEFWLGDKMNFKLTKGLNNIMDCQFKYHNFNKVNFLGYGLASGNERIKEGKKLKLIKNQLVLLKRKYNTIYSKLISIYRKINKKQPLILISHNVPYNTKLDIIKNKKSSAYKIHLGSSIARKFCEKYQPLLCIGGHIHEGKGIDKIGKTIVINPGFGENAQVLIDIDENKGKIRNIKFFGKKR